MKKLYSNIKLILPNRNMGLNNLFFILLFLFLFSVHTYANYSTPGTGRNWNLDSLVANSSGNVTYSGGIYFINDTLIVSASDTIKININATVKVSQLVVMNFLGTLIINPPDSVKITAIDTTQSFYELRLDSTSDASIIKKLIFEYSFNGIRMLDSSPLIDSCIIRNNCIGNTSVTATAINLFRSNAVIQNSKIYNNYRVAIGGGANIANAPQILNNLIYNNNSGNGNVPQINLGTSGSGTTLIKGNTITGLYNNTGGIATLPIGALSIRIENNIIKFNRYGIAIGNVNTIAVITGNIIDSNNINPNANTGGSGINFNGNSTLTAVVSRNFIRGNLWGITIQVSAKPNIGNLNNTDTSDDGRNTIYGNKHNDSTFDLYNNTADSIYAQNNYWGSSNIDTIESHIFHKPDNAALGFVNYVPFLSDPIGIINVTEQTPSSFKLYNAYPNPFNPETKIKFDLPKSSIFLSDPKGIMVRLKIYDVSGREVETLLNNYIQPGRYEVAWNASGYASGVYFVTLSTVNFNSTRKLILLK